MDRLLLRERLCKMTLNPIGEQAAISGEWIYGATLRLFDQFSGRSG